MRFSTILVGAFAALVAAQSTAVSAPATSVSLDPAQSTYVNCLKTCRDDDVNCRAKCGNVPFPNEQQVNATNTCAAACPKGKGTEAEVIQWGECVQACIGKNYYTVSGGTPQATGAAGSGSGSGSGSSSSPSGTAGSGSNPASTTGGSGASKTSAPANPADVLRVGSSAVGLIGFLAAFLVL